MFLGVKSPRTGQIIKRKELVDMSKKRKGEMSRREMKKIEKIKEANRRALIEAWQKGRI